MCRTRLAPFYPRARAAPGPGHTGGLVLPDTAAVHAYLIGRILPAAVADRVARAVIPPLEVTERGALVRGRKPG